MGGKGGHHKLKGPKKGEKKTILTADPSNGASSGKATARSSSKRVAKAPAASPAASSAAISEYSDDEAESAPRAMALDAKTTAAMKREAKKATKGTKPTPAGAAVLYLGHIPHGFYEEQMRGFFSQFGTVSRLRLARNKKTGRSKHYAFIEFKQAEVGEVVANAMNGYLLYSKVLVAKIVPPSQVHSETFKGANRPFKIVDRVAVIRKQHNRARTPEQASKREERLLKAEKAKRKRLADLGIDYEFTGYDAAATNPHKRMRGVVSGDPQKEKQAEAPPPPAATKKPKESKDGAAAPAQKKKRKEAEEAVAAAPPPAKKLKAAPPQPEPSTKPAATKAAAAAKPAAKSAATKPAAAEKAPAAKAAKPAAKKAAAGAAAKKPKRA